MGLFEFYLAVLLKFLTASLLLERMLEYLDSLLQFFGIIGGNKAILLRLNGGTSDSVRGKQKKALIMQLAGLIIGSAVCFYGELGLLASFHFFGGEVVRWWDTLLAGLFISGGSEPIHRLINQLKLIKVEAEAERRQLAPQPEPVLEQTSQLRLPEYKGGIEPERGSNYLRRKNPRYIIVHQTGLPAGYSFPDLVERHKDLGAEPGGKSRPHPAYHAVVDIKGKIYMYGRWDCLANHLPRVKRAISNGNTLALALHGVTEKDTEIAAAQLQSATQILALWHFLYKIPVKDILPANPAKDSGFAVFTTLLEATGKVVKDWQENSPVQKQIADYGKKEYIYV